MLTVQRFKTTAVFVALAVLLIGAVVAYARDYSSKGSYDKNVYWQIGVGYLTYDGTRTSSYHNYAVENDSNVKVSADWEFTHRIMVKALRPGGGFSEFRKVSRTGFVKIDSNGTSYHNDTFGVNPAPRDPFYIDAYTSIEIKRLNVRDPKVTDSEVRRKSGMFNQEA